MKPKEAFPRKTINAIFTPWDNAIKSRECLSVVNIPKRDQLYRLKEITSRYRRIKNIQLIALDLKGQIIEDPYDLKTFLAKKINKRAKKIALIVLDADQLLDEKNVLLSYLDILYHDNPKLILIYLFQKNITYSSFSKKLSKYTSLYQNVNIYSFFKQEEIRYFLKFIKAYFQVQIPAQLEKEILFRCGGSPWLIKEAVRHYYQTRDEKNIFDHDNMRLKLNILFQELSSEEKSLVEKIVKKDFQFLAVEKSIIRYLIRTGLLLKKTQQFEISIPIFKDFVKDLLNSKTQICLNHKNQLLLNGVLVEGFFSRRQKLVLRLFISNRGKILAREKVAAKIWQKDTQNYTDWALDQIIRRLRNKLVRLGLNRYLIKTVKNQGYSFS